MRARVWVRLGVVVLLAVLGAAVGCSKTPDDAKIASAIQQKFSGDSGLQNKQLSVQSEKGTVTLSGTVDNDVERQAASRYAAAVPGVKQVVNNLQVGAMQAENAAPPAAPAAVPSAPAPSPAAATAPAAKPSPRRHRHHEQDAEDHNPQFDADEPAQNAQAQPAPPLPPPTQTPPAAQAPPDSSAAAAPAASAAPPPPPQKVTIASGTGLSVRLIEALDSESCQPGQTFHATLNSPLTLNGQVVVPAGYEVEGFVVDAKSAGKFQGKAELTLELNRIKVGDKTYNIQTDQFHREGASRGKSTAEKVGAGSVLGAVIGAIAGGGKGAAIGAAAGGGVGGGVQAASKPEPVRLPSETVLSFTLQAPLSLIPTTAPPPRAGAPHLNAAQSGSQN